MFRQININNNVLELDPITDDKLPTVSIVTITYNRSHFSELMIRNWKSIDYPPEKLEWIIIDDSDQEHKKKLQHDINNLGDKRIKIIQLLKKVPIGTKRNLGAFKANNEYVVHYCDDDYYPKLSVITRIRVLLQDPCNFITGCCKVNCYDLLSDNSFESFDADKDGYPYTISESTMAYKKNIWAVQKFNNEDTFNEGLAFIKGREQFICTIPSYLIITQLTHTTNTITRRVNTSTSISESYNFLEDISLADNEIINRLRLKFISEVPEYKEAIEFVEKCKKRRSSASSTKCGNFIPIKNQALLSNPCVIEYRREHYSAKNNSTGKDIVYFCGPGLILKFSNNLLQNTGGSELAVIMLSKAFVQQGFNVTVYCVIDKPVVIDGVKYEHYWNWNPLDKQDATIIWRDPSNCRYKINSKVFLDLHDTIVPDAIDKYCGSGITIMTKSKFHKEMYKNCKNKKVIVVPNGIIPLKVKERNDNEVRIVNTSSPERGINALLYATNAIKNSAELCSLTPRCAEVYWCYGFSSGINKGGLENIENKIVKDWVTNTKQAIKNTPGFHDLGRLPQEQVDELYENSDYFVYGTTFDEIDCISFTKACSAGCIPIVTGAGALKEKMEYLGLPYCSIEKCKIDGFDHSLTGEKLEEWTQLIIRTINGGDYDRKQIANKINSKYNINGIAKMWINLL
jgi:glycosyltransferase involved in cell wall biosynthesis